MGLYLENKKTQKTQKWYKCSQGTSKGAQIFAWKVKGQATGRKEPPQQSGLVSCLLMGVSNASGSGANCKTRPNHCQIYAWDAQQLDRRAAYHVSTRRQHIFLLTFIYKYNFAAQHSNHRRCMSAINTVSFITNIYRAVLYLVQQFPKLLQWGPSLIWNNSRKIGLINKMESSSSNTIQSSREATMD